MRPSRGFTLLEMMVVIVIVGTLLLLVPANLQGFGARSRLESASNTLVSALAYAREKAILDGYEVRFEVGAWKDEEGRHEGHRIAFTNVPPPKAGEAGRDESEIEQARRDVLAERGKERQWLFTQWHPVPPGVRIAGFSEEAKRWQKVPESEPYRVSFLPDGSVQKGFAVRLESTDLDTKREERTRTVLVNGLTAEASAVDGDGELPGKRESRDFP